MKLRDLVDVAAGDCAAELLEVSAWLGEPEELGETAGCDFHNHPRLLDSTEIEKATAVVSTTLTSNSGIRVLLNFKAFRIFRVVEL